MARVNTYLNFQGQTEQAFTFYAKTFGTQITMLSRYSDMPAATPPQLSAEDRELVMHAELPITAGHVLMATDMVGSLGQETRIKAIDVRWPNGNAEHFAGVAVDQCVTLTEGSSSMQK